MMEFDQSYNSAHIDWSFPSPNATPTHGSFGSNGFQTPKTSTISSHFQDPFTTPHMPSYATPQQPHYSSMTPMQRPQTSSETLRSNFYANIQAVGSQSVSPGIPSGQFDHHVSTLSPHYGNTYSASMQPPMHSSFDPAQMQTPPPTRGASGRKQQHGQPIAFGTPSTIASRRFTTPQQAFGPADTGSLPQQPQLQFPQLQFSPEMYQFANFGPASAPVMPQSRILWDQTGSPIQPLPQTTLDDPFVPGTVACLGWNSVEPSQNVSQTMSFDTPSMAAFPVQQPQPRPTPARALSASFTTSSSKDHITAGVDPSLLYSSPIRPVLRSNGRSDKMEARAAAGEKQYRDVSSQSHQRTHTMSSTSTATSRSSSNLQRSNTTGVGRPKSALLSLSGTDVPRTASPVKRLGRPALGSITEGRPRQRTSVILTVDANGIARTETKRVDESPTKSMRERYPALFDSDSSDAESDTSGNTPSRSSSFIFDQRDERRAKAARLDPPVENLEGLSIPRSSSSASMRKGIPPSRAAVAAAAQLRRQGSLRRSTPSRNSSRRNLTSSSTTYLIDTAPMDFAVDHQLSTNGSALSANPLSHVQDGSTNWASYEHLSPPSSSETTLDIHNRRWSMMSFEQQHQQQQFQASMFSNFSPPLGGPNQRQIRCSCGISADRGQHLVQCGSCTQWLHAPCVVPHDQHIPSPFTCFLCTMPPPSRPAPGRLNGR